MCDAQCCRPSRERYEEGTAQTQKGYGLARTGATEAVPRPRVLRMMNHKNKAAERTGVAYTVRRKSGGEYLLGGSGVAQIHARMVMAKVRGAMLWLDWKAVDDVSADRVAMDGILLATDLYCACVTTMTMREEYTRGMD